MGLIKFVDHFNVEALTVVNTAFLVSATYQPNRVSLFMTRGESYQIDRQENPDTFDRVVNLLFENTLFDSQLQDESGEYFESLSEVRE